LVVDADFWAGYRKLEHLQNWCLCLGWDFVVVLKDFSSAVILDE
jgi:hypothetical protein